MLKKVIVLASAFLMLSPAFAKDKKQADFEALEKQVSKLSDIRQTRFRVFLEARLERFRHHPHQKREGPLA
ncbi:MAG: hypothetical protein B7Y39_10035 [Bdellovibrio sp. 28-41-41]|nr:MAG: hypothetical protein B7Y39_10035 [Bdellovibrio sp. 28-41-41]